MNTIDFACVGCGAPSGIGCDFEVIGTHERTPRSPQPLTPTTPEELVDSAWDRLGLTMTEGHGAEVRYVTRDQLAEFMVEAALMALDADPLSGPLPTAGPIMALLQSLRVMGDLRGRIDGNKGHGVICARAVACIERLTKDVTRFLVYPGLAVRHHSVDDDLAAVAVTFGDDGRATCSCQRLGDDTRQWRFLLSELNAAGPVDDTVRLLVAGIASAMVEDTVAQLVGAGQLQTMAAQAGVEPVAWLRMVPGGLNGAGYLGPCDKAHPGAFPVFGKPPEDQQLRDEREHNGGYTLAEEAAQEQAEVHSLSAHPEYVMTPGSSHAEVATALAKDKVAAMRSDDPPLDGQ